MTTPDTSLALAGCRLLPLDAEACEQYLAWLLGEPSASAPESAPGLAWALAHGDDGVTWGRYDARATTWHLGSQVAPEVSPSIRRHSLQDLRLFGEPSEVLVWRTADGLRGRVLRQEDPAADTSDTSNPLRPFDESRIIRGTRVLAEFPNDFTHIGDGTGAEQVLPLVVTAEQLAAGRVRLVVRHFYDVDMEIGAVRVAATRLVEMSVTGGAEDVD